MASAGSGVVIDIDLLEKDKEWLLSLRSRVEGSRLRRHSRDEPCTIFRVPVNIRKGDPDAYEPRVISFGPFCRNNPALEPMEQLKLQYVQRLLRRNPNEALEDYVDLIRGLEVRSRACYSENIVMGSHKFVEMMLLDGCFLVEFLLVHYNGGDSGSAGDEDEEEEEEEDDPVLSRVSAGDEDEEKEDDPVLSSVSAGDEDEEEEEDDPVLSSGSSGANNFYDIKNDMLLLENQIPFFIIEEVFKLATSGDSNHSSSDSLTNLLRRSFNHLFPNARISSPPPDKLYHLLHFIHSGIMPPASSNIYGRVDSSTRGFWRTRVSNKPSGSSTRNPEKVPCATMLMEAGVKFRVKKADSFLEVAFHNGTMEIPTLRVYDETNSIFRNLIAFEQCFPEVGTHITNYTDFLDCLIDNGKDVALLCQHGCIVNALGSDEEAAGLFNRLCKEVVVDNDSGYLASLFKDVQKHCDSRWPKHRAKLMRDYFSNPWSFLSLLGALIIILLTVVQSSFSILAYFNPQPTS